MSEPNTSPRLEQGTALSHLGDAVEDLRQTATELRIAVDDHAMSTATFLRDVADGRHPDPAPLLRSRGRVEALLNQLLERAELEGAHLAELNIALLPNPSGDPDLEARALVSFRERYRRRGPGSDGARRPPEDPRPSDA